MVAAACLALLSMIASGSAAPRYGIVITTAASQSDVEQTVFAKDTPAIHVRAQLIDMPKGTAISGAWVAENTNAAPQNFTIDVSRYVTDGTVNLATFSLMKPRAGWPPGFYRVDLYIAEALVTAVKFEVKP